MRKILLVFLTLFILLQVVIFFLDLSHDEELSFESNQLISKVKTNEESRAYYYLLGIIARQDEEPEEVGRQLFARYQAYENDSSYKIINYPASKKLPLPSGDLFCKIREEGCLKRLFVVDNEYYDLLKKHQVLLSRFKKFREFEEFTILTKPSIDEIIPPYVYIARAQRLELLSAIESYKQGQTEKSINNLLEQLASRRDSLAYQYSLIPKTLYLQMLSDIVDVLNIILLETGVSIEKINHLNSSEINLSFAAAREFVVSVDTMKKLGAELDGHQDDKKILSRLAGLLYKRNMSINAIEPFFTEMGNDSLLTPAEFAEKTKNASQIKPKTSKIRNYIGSYLINTPGIFIENYTSKFMDFNAKVELINHQAEGFDNAKNPYYINEAPVFYEDKVCFRGPIEDEVFRRCIRTKF